MSVPPQVALRKNKGQRSSTCIAILRSCYKTFHNGVWTSDIGLPRQHIDSRMPIQDGISKGTGVDETTPPNKEKISYSPATLQERHGDAESSKNITHAPASPTKSIRRPAPAAANTQQTPPAAAASPTNSTSTSERSTRFSAHTFSHSDPDRVEHPKGRHKKDWPRVPFIRRPIPRSDGPWLEHGQQAVSWLNLFYGECFA